MLATREVALGPGSYFSIWLDDAQLSLGQILRDDLDDAAGAIAAFRQLPADYPASILRDDALYELAVTLAADADDAPGACRAIADLRALEPDSKYIARAPRCAPAARLSCKLVTATRSRIRSRSRTSRSATAIRVVLDGVSLELAPGARLGLIGPAASGKTVLLKLAAGLERPDSGDVDVLGEDRRAATRHEADLGALRKRIGMLFQSSALFDFLDVAGNVAFPLEQRGGIAPADIAERVAARLRAVGLAGSEHKLIGELSGGMKKRGGIARATVTDAEMVIYDEPTAGLDPVTTQKIYDLLAADQARTGATVLAVSSDVVALATFVDEIAFLYRGAIVYRGPARTIADAPDPLVRQFVRGELEGPLQ